MPDDLIIPPKNKDLKYALSNTIRLYDHALTWSSGSFTIGSICDLHMAPLSWSSQHTWMNWLQFHYYRKTMSKKWRNHCINHLDIQAWQLLNTLKFYSKLMCRKVQVQKLSIIITWLGQPSTIAWRCTTVAAIKGIYICTDDTNSCRQAIPSWINICPPKCVMVSTAGWRFLRFLYTRWNNPSDP